MRRRIEVGGMACESSSWCVANTASVGVAWEASSAENCRCYSSKRGNVRKKIIFIFLNNIPSIIVVVSNQNMKMHTGPYGARTFGIIIL